MKIQELKQKAKEVIEEWKRLDGLSDKEYWADEKSTYTELRIKAKALISIIDNGKIDGCNTNNRVKYNGYLVLCGWEHPITKKRILCPSCQAVNLDKIKKDLMKVIE